MPVSVLPESVRQRLVDLEPYGENRMAIHLDDAAEVCELFAEAGFATLGGDYWRPDSDGFQRSYEVWAMPPRGGSDWSEYVKEALARALQDFAVRGPNLDPGSCVAMVAVDQAQYDALPSRPL
jgi:hypothetical protein